MKRKFKVLYTHQKNKKRKMWHDGFLCLSVDEKRAYLHDEDQKEISTVYIPKKKVESGVDLESDKYLIEVEEEISSQLTNKETEQVKVSEGPATFHINQVTKSRRKFSMPRKLSPKIETNSERPTKIKEDHVEESNTRSIWCNITNNDPSSEDISTKCSDEIGTSSGVYTTRRTSDLLALLSDGDHAEINKKSEPKILTSSDRAIRMFDLAGADEVITADVVMKEIQNSGKRLKFKKPRQAEIQEIAEENSPQDYDVLGSIKELQERFSSGLFVPTKDDLRKYPHVYSATSVSEFNSVEEYVVEWKKVLNEHLNGLIWDKLKQFSQLIERADLTAFLHKSQSIPHPESEVLFLNDDLIVPFEEDDLEYLNVNAPDCNHGAPCKVAKVSKQGPNTGRFFYTCAASRKARCKFFEWAHVKKAKTVLPPDNSVKINNSRSLTSYLRRNGIIFIMDCILTRRFERSIRKTDCVPTQTEPVSGKKCFYLKFPSWDKSLGCPKDYLVIASKSLEFEENASYIIKLLSAVLSSTSEMAVQLLQTKTLCDWSDEEKVNVLLVAKSSMEFNFLNALIHQIPAMPLIPHLTGVKHRKPTVKPVAVLDLQYDDMLTLAKQYADEYKLNAEQHSAINHVVDVMNDHGKSTRPVVLIDGVPGSGKTFLLSIIIIFLCDLINLSANHKAEDVGNNDAMKQKQLAFKAKKWKLLLFSDSDTRLDKLLLCLLGLSFDRFARVGNIETVTRSLLPHSVHFKGGSEEHLKLLKNMLRQRNQTEHDKNFILKSMELVSSGATKRFLHNAFLIATTCEHALASSLSYYKFPLVIIDGACAVQEPSALLPLARFSCEKLLLAGDSRLCSTSTNQSSLKLSLFKRLVNSGCTSVKLTSQYRYRDAVTSLLNHVFYDDEIIHVTEDHKNFPVVPGLPKICFYDVTGEEEMLSSGDFFNSEEAKIIADIIKLLLSNGVPGADIVVMTTYDAQVHEVTSELRNIGLFDMSDVGCILVTKNTRFTSERRIALISMVATTTSSGEYRDRDLISRLTRARNHVIFVANLSYLSTNERFLEVIDLCRKMEDGVQSSFQFRRFFNERIKACENNLEEEIPLRVENPYDVVLTSSLGDDESDLSDRESTGSCYTGDDDTNDAEGHGSVNMLRDSDDDLPLLRHRKKQFTISDDDDGFNF